MLKIIQSDNSFITETVLVYMFGEKSYLKNDMTTKGLFLNSVFFYYEALIYYTVL